MAREGTRAKKLPDNRGYGSDSLMILFYETKPEPLRLERELLWKEWITEKG